MVNELSSNNVTAGTPAKSGGVLRGELGTTLPTDASTPLDEALLKLGLVSEDGLSPTGERESENILDWGGDEIATLQTSHSSGFEFTLYSVFNESTLKAAFGGANVTVTEATASTGTLYTITEDGAELPNGVWVFDMKHKGKKMRIVLPNSSITTVEELPFVKGELNGFTVTLSAKKDENGIKVYRYYDDGVFSAA